MNADTLGMALTAIGALGSAYQPFKDLAECVRNKTVDQDLTDKIYGAYQAVVQLCAENAQLRNELERLQKEIILKESLGFDTKSQLPTILINQKQYPYCPACLNKHQARTVLQDIGNGYRCPCCFNFYNHNPKHPPERPSVADSDYDLFGR